MPGTVDLPDNCLAADSVPVRPRVLAALDPIGRKRVHSVFGAREAARVFPVPESGDQLRSDVVAAGSNRGHEDDLVGAQVALRGMLDGDRDWG